MELPVSATVDDFMPAGGVTDTLSDIGQRERERLAVSLAIMGDGDVQSKRDALGMGDPFIVSDARAALGPTIAGTFSNIVEDSFREGADPQTAAQTINEEQKKQSDWVLAGESFYLEHAVSLGDPNINHQTMTFATNLTIAETMLAEAMEENTDMWTVFKPFKYVFDAIDRWGFRAVPIGGIEYITNRPERMGNELVGAVTTMPPKEFEAFFAQYIQGMLDEGVLRDENIFALKELQYALDTAGEDPLEWFNRSLGVLDVAAVGGLLKPVVKGSAALIRAATPLQRVAALKGQEAATEAAAKMAAKGEILAIEDMRPQVLDPATSPVVRPSTGRTAVIRENNRIVREIGEYAETGALGRSVKSPEVVNAGKKIVDQMKKISNNPINGLKWTLRQDITGNPSVTVTMGNLKTGSPLPTKGAGNFTVKRLQDAGYPTARVEPIDPGDLSKGWQVEVDVPIDVTKTIDEMSVAPAFGPVRQALASVFGSKRSIEAELLNDLATMNEGSRDVIQAMIKPELKKIDAVNTESKKHLSAIYAELRDGPDAFIRDAYDEAQFRDKFYNRAGREPTQKEIEAYEAIQSVNDAAYIMASHSKLQEYVRRGFYGADILPADAGRLAPIRRVDNGSLTRKTEVVDAVTGEVKLVKDLNKNQAIWYVDEPMEGGQRFYTNVKEVKMLSHHDVMPYNAGGRRLNPDANFFVTIGDINPRAVIQAFTEGQAKKAVADMNEIRKAVVANGGLDGLRGTDELNDLVRRHNEWNPSIQSMDDFVQWAKAKGLDMKKPISFKARDAQIVDEDKVNFGFASNWGEHYSNTLHRYDDAVMEYGGKEARQRDPITAIFEDFQSQAAQYSHSVYNVTAINSWVKAAAKKGSGWEVPKHNDPRRQFEMARRDPNAKTTQASELDFQRKIIQTRVHMTGEYGRTMQRLGKGIQEFVFDKTGAKLANDTAQKAESKALGLGFQSVFGFFNPAQFLVQGAHMITIAGIAPRHGIKGATMAVPMRMAFMADDLATETKTFHNLAKGMGMTTDEMDEMVEFIRQSGRQHIEASAIQKGMDRTWGASGWKGESWRSNDFMATADKSMRKALDAGTFFFRQGEGSARMAAQITAYLEFKDAHKGVSVFSDFGRRTIGRREKDLSFRMTNADRATIQSGVAKVPTQWFSYSMRAMEMATIGRGFTKREKARIALMLTAFYGGAGFGMERGAEQLADWFGAEPAGTAYNFLRGGILDTLSSWVGLDVDWSGRLAPITLYTDLYKGVVGGEKTVLQVAGGPALDIGTSFFGSIWPLMGHVVNGRTHQMTEDLVRRLRNISTVDNTYKAWGIIQNGTYRSRSGSVFPGEMSTSDAVAQLMGFSPREVGQWYERNSWQQKRKSKIYDFQRRMIADLSLAFTRIENGDTDAGYRLMEEIELSINFSGYTEAEKIGIRRAVFEYMGREAGRIAKMMEAEHKRGNPYGARVIEETIQVPGTGDN